jgi:hypothetical protein
MKRSKFTEVQIFCGFWLTEILAWEALRIWYVFLTSLAPRTTITVPVGG